MTETQLERQKDVHNYTQRQNEVLEFNLILQITPFPDRLLLALFITVFS